MWSKLTLFEIFILLAPTSTWTRTFSGGHVVFYKVQSKSSYLKSHVINSIHNYCCFPVIIVEHVCLNFKTNFRHSNILPWDAKNISDSAEMRIHRKWALLTKFILRLIQRLGMLSIAEWGTASWHWVDGELTKKKC